MSAISVTNVLLLIGMSFVVFVCIKVSDKVEHAIENRSKTTWIMEHETETSLVEQPTCIEKEIPKCGIKVKFYQRPDESMEDFVKRVQIEIGIIEANWGG